MARKPKHRTFVPIGFGQKCDLPGTKGWGRFRPASRSNQLLSRTGLGPPAAGTKGQVFCVGQNLTRPPTHDWNCGSGCFRPGKRCAPIPVLGVRPAVPRRWECSDHQAFMRCQSSVWLGCRLADLGPRSGGRHPLESNRMECQMTASEWTSSEWVCFARSFSPQVALFCAIISSRGAPGAPSQGCHWAPERGPVRGA